VFTWVEHTGELELAVEADSPEDVFEQAMEALGELLAERSEGGPGADTMLREVTVSAPDYATLLAEWLAELAYLAETEGFVPERVERLRLSERALDATVAGRVASPAHLVKAVTYHRLEMLRDGETWRARVILDV
jgi:SHS2 domain-containing protein